MASVPAGIDRMMLIESEPSRRRRPSSAASSAHRCCRSFNPTRPVIAAPCSVSASSSPLRVMYARCDLRCATPLVRPVILTITSGARPTMRSSLARMAGVRRRGAAESGMSHSGRLGRRLGVSQTYEIGGSSASRLGRCGRRRPLTVASPSNPRCHRGHNAIARAPIRSRSSRRGSRTDQVRPPCPAMRWCSPRARSG